MIINILYKIILIFLFYSIKNLIHINKNFIIEIDNKINESLYENNIYFYNKLTNLKIIAIYFPQYVKIKANFSFSNNNVFYSNKSKNIKSLIKKKNLSLNNIKESEIIKEHVKIAKNHGIYAFGIYYYWFSGIKLYDQPIKIFSENNELNFPFFIIWKNDNFKYEFNNTHNILIEQKYNDIDPINFINEIKNYLISKNYMKIKGKPVLGIFAPKYIPNLKLYVFKMRKEAYHNKIAELYILGTINGNISNNYFNIFNGMYEYQKNINLNNLINRNNYLNNIRNYPIYRCIMLEMDNSVKMKKYFNLNFQEKINFFIKNLIEFINYKNKNNEYIFINTWNNLKDVLFLEPNEKFGYKFLNSISKALFNISFSNDYYNLSNLKKKCKVVVQAHIFYEDLIIEIINKTNNIPVKFDLYTSTTSVKLKNEIYKNINKLSKANNYEILVVKNKGRDILPLLIQLKYKYKQYKYLCHIHTKKSLSNPQIGKNWRSYLYNNLLGNKRIVSEILYDFENIDKLGFVFPETYYEIVNEFFILTKKTKKYMKYIINNLFPSYKLGNNLDFPAGNMFWARMNSIHQIFEHNFYKKFNNEKDQINDTIMHGIERIWLYLVKFNGFYYKKIFKSF